MSTIEQSYTTGLSRYRIKTILVIAVFWTLIDFLLLMLTDITHLPNPMRSVVAREVLVFLMSFILGYLFVFTLKSIFRKFPLWINFLLKTLVILLAALLMNFLVHLVQDLVLLNYSVPRAVNKFFQESMNRGWLIEKTIYWVFLLIVTQLYIEVNEKYSPGVFLDIIMGKYFHPKVENRIVMFIDLKDSTPIAEKLGHQHYFLFIREFIYNVSMALIEYNGRIYQYVGDEIVVSWSTNKKNIRYCLASVIEARKNIQKNSEKFRRLYNVVPEFRVGIHVGDVTVGEIGVIKKDLAMSGDTMNTTARIRSACNELNQKFIVSREFFELSELKDWQAEDLGMVDLKGKSSEVELFALKI